MISRDHDHFNGSALYIKENGSQGEPTQTIADKSSSHLASLDGVRDGLTRGVNERVETHKRELLHGEVYLARIKLEANLERRRKIG